MAGLLGRERPGGSSVVDLKTLPSVVRQGFIDAIYPPKCAACEEPLAMDEPGLVCELCWTAAGARGVAYRWRTQSRIAQTAAVYPIRSASCSY